MKAVFWEGVGNAETVIPREGVESLPGGLSRDVPDVWDVIPREGVESFNKEPARVEVYNDM